MIETNSPARVGLRDLIVWVLAAGVYFALMREATGFWGAPVPIRTLDIDRVLAVVLTALAVLLGLKLSADTLRCRRGMGIRLAFLAAVLAALSTLTLNLSTQLKLDENAAGAAAFFNQGSWQVRVGVLALSLALVGVLLAAVPTRAGRARKSGPASVAANLLLSGAAGLVILAIWAMPICYLVLLAIDAVKLAMRQPGLMAAGHTYSTLMLTEWGPLHARLARAGIDGTIGLASCFLTAHWLGRSLRGRAVAGWPGLVYRSSTACLTWGVGLYLMFVGIPRLNPWMAEGLAEVLFPREASVIAIGFLALTAGLAFRGASRYVLPDFEAPAPPVVASKLNRRVLTAAIALLAFLLVASSLSHIRRDSQPPWYAPFSIKDFTSRIADRLTIATSDAVYFDLGRNPEAIVPIVALALAAVAFVRLFRRGALPSPIDLIALEPRRSARLVGEWLALSGVVLTLFPSFVLLGLALVHFGLRT